MNTEKEIYEKGLFEIGGNVLSPAAMVKIIKDRDSLLNALKELTDIIIIPGRFYFKSAVDKNKYVKAITDAKEVIQKSDK